MSYWNYRLAFKKPGEFPEKILKQRLGYMNWIAFSWRELFEKNYWHKLKHEWVNSTKNKGFSEFYIQLRYPPDGWFEFVSFAKFADFAGRTGNMDLLDLVRMA